MDNLSQRIKDLENKLKEANLRLKVIIGKSLKLKSQDRQEIQEKEVELEKWRKESEVHQQTEANIKKEIKDKVNELEQSQLSNTEKQEKINQLLMEHGNELERVDDLLFEERNAYHSIRDTLISKLCENCTVCQERERMIQVYEDRVSNLRIFAGLMCLASILFFFLFLYGIYYLNKREREREREREQLAIAD